MTSMDATPSKTPRLKHLLRAMRPVQWVKNVFVLAPLVFGLKLTDPTSVFRAIGAFLAFCLVASAVYLLNDLKDRVEDARHPTKCRRPIASGALPVHYARNGMFGLILGSIALGMALHWTVAAVLGGYLANNVAYTLRLKHIAYVDITCIALGFLLRVLAGGFAIDIEASTWLLACTFLLASLLALGKRRHELVVVLEKGQWQGTRAVLRNYQLHHIDWAMRALALITVASYALYTLSANTVAQFNTDRLIYSVPFVLFGLWRFNTIVRSDNNTQSPTDSMVRDLPFILNVILWGLFVTVTIYLSA